MQCQQLQLALESEVSRISNRIADGVEYEASGEHLPTRLVVVQEAAKSDEKTALDLVRERMVNGRFHKEVRKQLGEKIKAQYGTFGSYGWSDAKETQLVDARIKGDYAEVVLGNGVYKFDLTTGAIVSEPTKNGKQVRVVGIDEALNKAKVATFETTADFDRRFNHQEIAEQIDRLRNGDWSVLDDMKGSFESTGTIDLAEYTKQVGYEHGNIESMKQMLRVLHTLGGNKASEEYVKHVTDLFDAMHPRFFHNMDVYIKTDESDTQGWVSVDKEAIIVNVAKDEFRKKVYQSEAEVYAHEVIHTMVHWAFRNGSTQAEKLKRQLRYTMQKALESTSWKDLLTVDENVATEEDVKRAKTTYEYVFNSKHAEEEFIAYALTNPKMMDHLSTVMVKDKEVEDRTLFEKLVGVFRMLMDVVIGKFDFGSREKSVRDQVFALAIKMGEVNYDNAEMVKRMNPLDGVSEYVTALEGRWTNFAADTAEKWFGKEEGYITPLGENATAWDRFKYHMTLISKSIMHDGMFRKTMGLYASIYGIPPDSTVREFMATLLDESEARKRANWLGLQFNTMDRIRNSVDSQVKTNVVKAFNRPLSEEQESALTRVVLDTNLSSLATGKDGRVGLENAEIRELLTDHEVLGKRLKDAKNKLYKRLEGGKSEYRGKWTVNQAVSLGYFMATHKAHAHQNYSAKAIARGVLFNERFKVEQDVVNLIEEVATLVALQYTDSKKKAAVADLMKHEYEGVRYVMTTYEAFKTESRNELFKADEYHMMDGYSREIFDDTIEVLQRPIKEKAELEKMGFRYEGPLSDKNNTMNKERMGLFISEIYSRAERLRGAAPLGDHQAKGSSLKDRRLAEDRTNGFINFERDKARADLAALKIMGAMMRGDFDPTKVDYGMGPVINQVGVVVDYRDMMDKEQKEKLLKQDVKVSSVLGRSMASIPYKVMKEEHEKKVLEEIKRTMAEEWEEGEFGTDTLTEFTLIGPDVDDRKNRELYYMLPRSFREYTDSRSDRVMAVPTELYNIWFGYSHGRLTDLDKWGLLPKAVKRVINMVGSYWVDLVQIMKGNVLLKMPWILMFNLVSNVIQGWVNGIPLRELMELYGQSFKDVRAYLSAHKEAVRLELEIKTDKELLYRANDKNKVSERIYKNEVKLKQLKSSMESNQVAELVNLGMLQTVVEDVETAALNDTNKISRGADAALKYVPGVIKTPLQWLYLSKETKWYQLNQEVLQMSDLMARDVQNRWMKSRENRQANGELALPREFVKFMREEGGIVLRDKQVLHGETKKLFLQMAEKNRHYGVLKSFVNYNQPNGKLEEYANRVGLLMFTKYVKNIQRVAAKASWEHPIRTAAAIAMASVGIDIIQDQLFMTKGFGPDGEFSIENIFPVYGPADVIATTVNPPLIQLGTELFYR